MTNKVWNWYRYTYPDWILQRDRFEILSLVMMMVTGLTLLLIYLPR